MRDFFRGDTQSSIRLFDEVLTMDPVAETWLRVHAHFFRGLGLHRSGRSDEALAQMADAIAHDQKGDGSASGGLRWSMLFLRALNGELPRADRRSERLLRSAAPRIGGWLEYLFGGSGLRRFELDTAHHHLSRLSTPRSWMAIDGLIASVLVLEFQGNSDQADASLHRAREAAVWSGKRHHIRCLDSVTARIALMRGDLQSALKWQRSHGRSFSIAHAFVATEVPAITECRVLAASPDRASQRSALGLLDAISKDFRSVHFEGQLREIEPLRAFVLSRLGKDEEALRVLASSVEMAAEHGWIRPFVELGRPMADLLERLPAEDANRSFVSEILSKFPVTRGESGSRPATQPADHAGCQREKLTNREVDVLELLALRLRDKEIAERLAISPATVKTHLKSLYRKLDCRSRQEAVEAAVEKNFLRPPQP